MALIGAAVRSLMRDPLLLPCAALAGGIWLGSAYGIAITESLWLLAFLLFACVARTSWLRRLSLGLTLILTGTFLAAWHRPPAAPKIDADPREIVIVEGCVVVSSAWPDGREQFVLELAQGSRMRVMRYLDADNPAFALRVGERMEMPVRIREPRNFRNPGAFDYAAYLARQHVYWTATVQRGAKAKRLPGVCGSRLSRAIGTLRTATLRRIESLYPNDPYRQGMLEAVLIGETARLQPVWTNDFRRSGTFHALVISGTHVAVLAAIALFSLRLIVSEFAALLITCSATWLYALVAGFSAPVVRAAAGFSLYLIARWMFRRARVLNLLAVVAMVYFCFDPFALFDASFQLSFLAVATLGAFASPVGEAVFQPYSWALRRLNDDAMDAALEPKLAQFRVELRLVAETFAVWLPFSQSFWNRLCSLALRLALFCANLLWVSLVMQVGMALPMVFYFHRISLTGISANLLIVPMFDAIIPLGFAAIFSGWRWLAQLTGHFLAFAAAIARFHSRWEPPWRLADPPLWLASVCVASLILLALAIRGSRWRGISALATAGAFAFLVLKPAFADAQAAGQLQLTAIDVGQGDSLLLEFPRGQRILIDGGGFPQFGPVRRSVNLDTGEDVVSPYLWSRGIRHIDVIVATHAHEDHTGGLAALIENFNPSELWVGANPPLPLIEHARARHVRVVERRQSTAFAYGGASVEILSPPDEYQLAKPGNNDSLALRVVYGNRSFLLTGDMEDVMERLLLTRGLLAHSDVLKVAHHGSRTSTGNEFLEAVSPQVALISAGALNSFGHPHPLVVRRLVEHRIVILRTDRDGLVSVRTDGRRLFFDGMLWQPRSLRGGFEWVQAEE